MLERPARGLALMLATAFAAAAPAAADEVVGLRWLGVAGFSIEADDRVIVHDPFLSRPGMLGTLFGRYRPDSEVLGRLLAADGPAPEVARARLYLIGHSHYDHLGDAPWLAARTEGRVAGSATTRAIAQAYGLEDQRALLAPPGWVHREGPFEIRVVESRHARVLFGRVPLPGEVTTPPDGPIHAFSFKLGDARGYLVTHLPSGLTLYLLSSAGVLASALEALSAEGVRADVVLAAVQGRDEEFTATLVRTLRPRLVIPHHFDDFFRGVDDPEAGAPSSPEDLDAFEAEVRAAAESEGLEVEVRRPALFERIPLFGPAPR